MSAITNVITAILERAKMPGVDSLIGIRMRKAFERDLLVYFKALGKELRGLKLEQVAAADNPETALHGAEMAIMRVLRKMQPSLIFAISSNVYLGLLEGDRQTKAIHVSEATQPSGQPPLNPDVLIPTLQTIDQLGLSGQEAADYAARRAAELVKGIDQTTLQLLREAIEKGIDDQLGVQGLARYIRQYVQDMSVYRSQMIATTEMNDAFSEATMRKLRRLGVEYKQWITAPDSCDECADLDGEVVAVDDLFSSGDDRPPVHPNCLTADAVVAATGVTAYTKRWFEGEVVILRTADMDELTITPNHAVLTDAGWVAAGEVLKGANLVKHRGPASLIALLGPDDHLMPTRFEEAFDAALKAHGMTISSVPQTAEHFHGDGMIEGEVDVVTADRLLADVWNVGGPKSGGAKTLSRGHRLKSKLASVCSFEKFLKWATFSANGIVSGGGKLLAGVDRRLGHAEEHGVGGGPDRQPTTLEHFAKTGAVAADDLGELNRRLAGHVATVQVVDVVRVPFAGHVYNLEAAEGFYFANGLVVHNCRCAVVGSRGPDDEEQTN